MSPPKPSTTTLFDDADIDVDEDFLDQAAQTLPADDEKLPDMPEPVPGATETSNEWEEPHPGRRLSFPMEETMSWDAWNEGRRGGVAAKAYGLHQRGRMTGSRQQARMRVRANLKPLKIPTHASGEDTVMRSAPLPFRTAFSPSRPLFTKTIKPETPRAVTKPLDVDSDGDTEMGSSCSDVTPPSELLGPGPFVNDPSGVFDISLDGELPSDTAVAIVDSEYYSHAAPEPDLYGWEAALNHKTQMACSPSLDFQRAGAAKRSLLHRVLNFGPRDATEPASR